MFLSVEQDLHKLTVPWNTSGVAVRDTSVLLVAALDTSVLLCLYMSSTHMQEKTPPEVCNERYINLGQMYEAMHM